jgi:lipopolysaccharide export system protein LptA
MKGCVHLLYRDLLTMAFSRYCLLGLLLFLLPVGTAGGTEPAAKSIHIEADRMESDPQQNMVIFSGQVRAAQNDVIITADTMTVNYAAPDRQEEEIGPQTAAGQGLAQKIESILATGNVTVVKGALTATGDTMTFFSSEQKVILAGNAKAREDQNEVSGERIILYLDEGRSVVEGSGPEGTRVKAFIRTDGGVSTEQQANDGQE